MHILRAFATVPTLASVMALGLACVPAKLAAQSVYEFDVDEARSSITLHVGINPPIGSSDDDEAVSALGGTISASLESAPASFSEVHIESMELVLLDAIDLDFDFGRFVGGLEIAAPPDELTLTLSVSGPPAAVTDTSFLQPNNTFALAGRLQLDPSGLIRSLGIGDEVDLNNELIFDIAGSITELEEMAQLRIPLSIVENTEISGVPVSILLEGIVYATTSFTRTDTDHDELPAQVALSQNYPNPFNPRTAISFTLNRAEHVTLRVYDPLGRLVATLLDGPLAAGEHEVVFDAGDIPSGIYLYRLSTGSTERQRTMVLLK